MQVTRDVQFNETRALLFQEAKKSLLEGLPALILAEREKPSYIRPKLVQLDPEKMKQAVAIPQPPQGLEHFVRTAQFYPWNSEGIQDCGWGCAYRAIQTSLSAYKIHVSIEHLFHLMGPQGNLQLIYTNKYPDESVLEIKSPYELKQGWAEPFIGEMAMHFYGIHSDLEYLNGRPKYCNAPPQVFHHSPLSFADFRMRLEAHFRDENPAPVMIDDSSFSLNVVGIGRDGSNTKLWIADPHFKEDCSELHSTLGFFTVTLDEMGNQINCSLLGDDEWQLEHLYSEYSQTCLQFAKRNWMVLFPNSLI